MKALLQRLGRQRLRQRAQGMIEYALIAAFICGITATVFAAPGWMPDMINGMFDGIQTEIETLTAK